MNTEIDHLVVVADSLEQGAAWCEAELGVPSVAGGKHPLMGTHNRLLAIPGPVFPKAYLEIIAIDAQAPPPARPRWFGMDEPQLRQAVRSVPRLVHAVLRTPNVEMLRWGLINLGCNPGPALAAERATPQGRLAWRILVRDDGAIDCQGTLPTLIEWQGMHPADALPPSQVSLAAVKLGRLPPGVVDLLRLRAADFQADGPALCVTLATPRGPVSLGTAS